MYRIITRPSHDAALLHIITRSWKKEPSFPAYRNDEKKGLGSEAGRAEERDVGGNVGREEIKKKRNWAGGEKGGKDAEGRTQDERRDKEKKRRKKKTPYSLPHILPRITSSPSFPSHFPPSPHSQNFVYSASVPAGASQRRCF